MNDPAQYVALERRDDGVAALRMQDEATHNALSRPMMEQLIRGMETIGTDEGFKVCLLEGLDDVFCSGGTREDLLGAATGRLRLSDIAVTDAVLRMPIPVIAVMQGHAVGGGLPLGLAADLVLMARESRYGATFMNLGFTPGMGTTGLLPEAVGEHLAAEMMFGGATFRGTRFATCPGINYVLPRAQVPARALDLARRIAEKPRHALVLLKRTLAARKRGLFEAAHAQEAAMHEQCFAHPKTAEWIEQSYLQDGQVSD